MELYIPRAVEPFARRCSDTFKAIAVTGPRQVGKTTMLRHMAEEEERRCGRRRAYVTLDDAEARYLAQSDPALFMATYAPPVLIDEVQKAPELFPYLKIALDASERNGTVWLTGSQPLHLKRRLSESLAGRVAILEMLGFSQAELSGRPTEPFVPEADFLQRRARSAAPVAPDDLYAGIWKGQLPQIRLAADEFWEVAYRSYVDTYLMRDIRESINEGNERRFRTFMKACAAMTGQPVNYALLAEVADISEATAKEWLSVLESSYVVKLAEPFASNLLKRLQKRPVLHMTDTGLAAYLAGFPTASSLASGALSGHVLESFCYAEIEKGYYAAGREADLSFLRTGAQKEIDLVLTAGGTVHPIEVKRTASPRADDIKNFSVLDPLGDSRGTGCVLCLADKAVPLDRSSWAFPVWAL